MNATEAWDRLLAIPRDERTPMEQLLLDSNNLGRLNYTGHAALIEYWRMVDELAELKAKQ